MEIQDHHRLLAYNYWANRETLASMKGAGEALPAATLKYMAHIIAAERLWLHRLKSSRERVVVWPENLTLEECEAQICDLADQWRNYIDNLSPSHLSTQINYTNSKGEVWTNSVADILTHVSMHSVYHRGQIASSLRASGHTPAYTDFIECVRREFVE